MSRARSSPRTRASASVPGRQLGLDRPPRDEPDAEAALHRAPHRLLEPELERHLEVAEPLAVLAQLVLDHLADARALLHQDQRPLRELVEVDGAAGERMAGRAREDHLVAEERLERDRAVPAGGADDPELEPPVGDELDHRLRVGHGQLDAELGVVALELAEQQREHDRRRPGGGADLERAAERRIGLGELVEQLLLEREHPLRAAVEAQPGLGRLDPAAGPVEQLRPEPLLERAHLLARRPAG